MQLHVFFYIDFDMTNYRYRMPSTASLYAFECVARYGSFSRAAEELRTSQPAVSRHVAGLEATLGAQLIKRGRSRATLTPEGQTLYHATVRGLDEIVSAVEAIRRPRRAVSIACTYSIAHLWLMPRHEALQSVLGDDVEIVTQSSEYEYHDRLREEGIDICLTFALPASRSADALQIFAESVLPVCSPAFARRHEGILRDQGAAALVSLPLLNLGQPNHGWMTWEDWSARQGLTEPDLTTARRFGNYVYLLEAACDGAGVALAWRGLSDEYLRQGRLVPLSESIQWTDGDGGFYIVKNPVSRHRDVIDQATAYFVEQGEDGAAFTVKPR